MLRAVVYFFFARYFIKSSFHSVISFFTHLEGSSLKSCVANNILSELSAEVVKPVSPGVLFEMTWYLCPIKLWNAWITSATFKKTKIKKHCECAVYSVDTLHWVWTRERHHWLASFDSVVCPLPYTCANWSHSECCVVFALCAKRIIHRFPAASGHLIPASQCFVT